MLPPSNSCFPRLSAILAVFASLVFSSQASALNWDHESVFRYYKQLCGLNEPDRTSKDREARAQFHAQLRSPQEAVGPLLRTLNDRNAPKRERQMADWALYNFCGLVEEVEVIAHARGGCFASDGSQSDMKPALASCGEYFERPRRR